MSDVMPPEPMLPQPPGRDPWTVWGMTASAMLHVGVLVVLLWQPPPASAEATQPPAVDVELVAPPKADSASEPPAREPEQQASAANEPPAKATPAKATPAEQPPVEKPPAETPPVKTASPEPPPAKTASPEPPQPAQAAAPTPSAATHPPEPPSETAAPKPISEAPATPASTPVRGSETPSAEVAPIPLSRPRVKGLTAPASVPEDAVSTVTADTGEAEAGTAPPAPSAEPDVATLELGPLHRAERFYLEAMLGVPGMARARAMLETLPPEKRLAQTCNIEALAQIGNAGEGFSPDVVMAEAYARSEMTGTRLSASGAIFRSGDRWYGLAFDCTLSDDLTAVTAFSYRLGADVTDAVLARLSKT